MMNEHLPLIIMNRIPHRLQRYDTTGDFFELSGVLHIAVSTMGVDMEVETLLHELFEWHLCQKAGVTVAMVDAWDFGHPELEDPGSHPDCPYREQHMKAMRISKVAVKLMGYRWNEYNKAYDELADRLSEERET